MKEKLGTKDEFKDLCISYPLLKIHEQLREKLSNFHRNGIRNYLTAHLYDIMPRNASQKAWIPKLKVRIGNNLEKDIPLTVKSRDRTYSNMADPNK